MASPWHPYVPPRNQRPDLELYAQAGQVGFFTIRSFGTSRPFTMPALNGAVVDVLPAERLKLRVALYVYCLMPDHLHTLIGPQEDCRSMLTFVDQFKGKSTRVAWGHGCRGKLWQKRSHDHFVRQSEDLVAIGQYILDNPVRRGLAQSQGDYPWAGLVEPLPL